MCKSNILVLVLSICGLFGLCATSILQNGQCETIPVDILGNFNVTEFAGRWKEARRTTDEGDCSIVDFTETETGLSFTNRAVNDNFLHVTEGNGTHADGVITFNITGQDNEIELRGLLHYFAVFSLLYTCENAGPENRQLAVYLLEREGAVYTDMMTEHLISTLNNNLGLTLSDLREVDHSETACYELPEIPAGQGVVLDGLCDPNMPAVPSFQVVDFLGQWHQLSSYHSENSVGTCARAQYGAGDGVVLVLNSEVVNQTLSTISGTATVASSDGSGRLRVILEVAPGVPVEQELLIIGTDYESFAVSYSCTNLTETNQRRVFSWILSRSPQITSVTQALIDETLRTQLDLNQRYYQNTPRSDDDCFYFPEPNGEPVVFRGQCDESIPVMADFNPVEYLGVWYSIASYPSQFIFGSCSTAYYFLREDGSVGVLNSQVVGERLFTIDGFAVVANASEPAKLEVTFPIEGTNLTVTTGYWVLDTDYTSYSLVYTCVPLENNNKAVTSWKLGRDKSFNATAEAIMDSIIDTILVLDDKYYQNDDQSVTGCFYSPDPVPGQVVVFPGQCENISTHDNFNITLFAGTWYELEAYPKDQQGGHCISHEYIVTGANTLSLRTSQIVNQFLEVTNGIVTADSDNNARLTIEITTSDGNVIPIPFWILSTDYENYALAYSCVNRNETFRAVYSWKLGREFTLSTEAIESINSTMTPVDVLSDGYFEPIDQSLAACFYLPDLAPGEPVVLVGQCELDIPRMQNFQPALYTGTWKLISTYPAEFQNGACQDARYTALSDGTVEVYNTQVIDQTLDTITGSAVIGTDDGTGLLLVTFPNTTESEYWILDTDYSSFALVYSCVNINERERRIYSWILSRNETLSVDSLERIDSVISNVTVLTDRYYQTVNRTDEDCFYFPEPDGNPVIFRGQCEQNITVVQDFNATAYLGLWHNIASYPSFSQVGTCSNADYSLGEGFVNVFNTEVIGQSLSTIDGVAYVNPDEPAKLIVSFPSVTNETSDYWVLATDYSTYSYVYSCVNFGEEYRQVWSWKLSRTKELTVEAHQAINQTMDERSLILDQRYYVDTDQSPEGCFYYPGAVQGVPVVFPGQCNNTIPVVSNFNITRFQGRWHEIEAYPNNLLNGDCLNHIVSESTGDASMVSNSVANLTLGTTNALLNVVSTTEPGRMTITYTTATGEVVTQPFWILETDYDDYAIAYSCVDNDDDTRNVYSWKLSRTKELSDSGTGIADSLMNTVDVLRSQYYWSVAQSDEACFFLPEVVPGAPVIFPGQCDLTIPVVANFDASRYLGRWRLMSSYPSAFQLGTCNDAYYSLGTDGSVVVYNTEVVDETLASITGSAQLIENGKLLVTFPGAPEPIEYWILDTDYDTYTLVYSCVNINEEERQVWSWIMSRNNTLSETPFEPLIESINVLDNRYYSEVDRTEEGCFYFPEVTNEPVLFRGQCNESIPVVQDFNVTAYLGHWYAIETYPQEFQFGTCPTALYSLNDAGSVDVYNTQVYQQRLDSINGTAVLASEDGSAKLEVTFPFPGFEVDSPYWVLDTDYENYALVYSCVNVDLEYYRVGSWKLARERNLTESMNNAIVSTMSGVKVLDQRYYTTWGHSDQQCFYYPLPTDGRILLDGRCEDEVADVVAGFDASRFAGPWYEAERFPSELQSGGCTANQFDLTSANTFSLTKTIINNERLETFTGTATVAADGSGVLSVTLSNNNGTSTPVNLNLYVLDTDYTSYALLYSCRNYDDDRKQVYSWKLSRYRDGLTVEADTVIDQIVTNTTDLFEDYYDVVSHDNNACFYYPVFDELPGSIELPGPCDDSIVGIPNFNVNSYSGRWFETSRYPQGDQSGTCSRAHYSVVAGTVVVVNTEVADQTLFSQAGTAELVANDGSGVINVTFAVGNEVRVATLYILATDYTSYSLAYSCQNLDNGNRLVFSWKLSRDRTLSADESELIDEVIEETQGLSNDYYIDTDQSDEACFYIPEVTDEAPLFRQPCDAITGQENFDITRFLGLWHEIESYPRDYDAGECVRSNYEATGNQVSVVDTGIYDLTAQFITGTVQADSNGRLMRFLVNGTTPFTQDVWVLSTDYESYALLYSCENANDNEYRRVWSAKYSRTRSPQFTDVAQAAMNAVISENPVLYPQFYQPTDQSANACFHYPEQTGAQVILPGQCDDDIVVIQNFNAVEYSGTWYQTERYPQVHESGDCSGARYTLDDQTGVVTVLNWEVVDGELETVEGTAVVSSEDGSGKLIVTLPVNGTEVMVDASLYVLTTDYVTYSLVYSCYNINEYERSVAAWKLSRTRTMPASGTTAINAYMATREELHQPYFIQVEQNEDCEEPNSSVFIRSSIIVTMICLAIKMLV